MKDFLVNNSLYIVLVLPILISIAMYIIGVKLMKNKWKSIHKMVQWTAIFYVVADILLVKMVFNLQLTGYLLISIILILAFILINQWKKENEVSLLKGLQLLWRINFLVFFFIYIGFIIFLIINYALL